jgi:UDP-arabinose 4-epimerase
VNAPRRVLVTGGAGYVGSHACKQLAAAGFEPVSYDNLCRGHESLVRFGPLIRGDLHDKAALRAALATVQPVACMHFAAFAYVAESVRDPALYYRNNVAGSLALLEALVEAGVRTIVFSSSCAVYGQVETLPISEDSPKNPMSPYGRTKLVVEEMLRDFDRSLGLRSVSLRYFNAAGADPGGELGEMHDPEPHVIPRALMAAAGIIPGFQVLGTDYPTPDGTAVRDYTHVSDLAAAHIAALEHLLQGGETMSLNLGLGRGYSVLEIIAAAQRVTGREIRIDHSPRRPGDPAEVVADPARAGRLLAFRPKHPELEDMVATAWRWFVAHGFRARA